LAPDGLGASDLGFPGGSAERGTRKIRPARTVAEPPTGITLQTRGGGHDDRVPQQRSLRLRRSQVIWLIAIVAAGVILGVAAGLWWGLGAAAVLLAISETIERVQRARR
jgi:hypothetical protein